MEDRHTDMVQRFVPRQYGGENAGDINVKRARPKMPCALATKHTTLMFLMESVVSIVLVKTEEEG